MGDAIYRYEVPVDGLWHTLQLPGEVLHVASRHPGVVEVWARTNWSAGLSGVPGVRHWSAAARMPAPTRRYSARRRRGAGLAPDGAMRAVRRDPDEQEMTT